ncbi:MULTISPECIES: heme exporter protein CcmD [unclassified Oceanobacter]|uniref:heme exporter protein CcmD n=1 Tax=unclassified Oceanobacter TaxID=2620260 RepID=UPI002735464D|nr:MULTISPECIES: heme exporter protein CcmD [unclassified Oceanobacter]MDP2609158.1 heme exporter protein CcmD [Oceanobacter sp. 1_MG-2023]MDP2612550.1 heme exporter protein CcmD [Oceanobacter sp. 2_MG-2023]
MEFHSVGEFLAMGRHGLYVWLSYGLSALVIIANLVLPMWQRRRLIREQGQRVRRDRRGQAAADRTVVNEEKN